MVIHKWYIKASSALQQRIYCSQNKLHKEGVSGAVEEKCMERERGQRWFCISGAAEKRVFEVNPTHALAIAEMDRDFEEASM